jgi:hypothetical protein
MQEAVNLVDRFMGIGWPTARKPREVLALLALLVVDLLALLAAVYLADRFMGIGWATARKMREVLALLALLVLALLVL